MTILKTFRTFCHAAFLFLRESWERGQERAEKRRKEERLREMTRGVTWRRQYGNPRN